MVPGEGGVASSRVLRGRNFLKKPLASKILALSWFSEYELFKIKNRFD